MRTKVTISIIFLLAVMAGLVALSFLGVLPSPAQKPFLPQEPLCAVSSVDWPAANPHDPSSALDAVGLLQNDPAAIDAALTKTVAAAKAGGANAVFFLAHPGGAVFYRSKYFAPAFAEYDPLETLCQKANAQGIAVFVVYCPEALGKEGTALPEGFAAAKLPFTSANGVSSFDLNDQNVLSILKKDVTALTHDYPIAGVAFYAGAKSPAAPLAALAQAVHSVQKDTLALLWPEENGYFADRQAAALSGGFDLWVARLADSDLKAMDFSLDSSGLLFDLSTAGDAAYDAAAAAGLLKSGALVGTTGQDSVSLSLRASAVAGLAAKPLPTVDNLALGWPNQDQTLFADHVLLLGSSGGSDPVTVNDAPVTPAAGGSWSVWAALAMGENRFVIRQGNAEIVRTITRIEPKKTKPVKALTPNTELDDSLSGRYIKITNQIASVLFDPAKDSAIYETLRAGAVLPIAGTIETLRAGQIVTAYQLAGGNVILAKNAELLAEAPAAAPLAFSACDASADRQLRITLTGGTPACYTQQEGRQVSFLFLGAQAAEDLSTDLADNCPAVSAAALTAEEAGVRLTLTFGEDFSLWGYDVSYAENSVVLRFTAAPRLSAVPGKPLSGVRILLDAGHGGTDLGAPGITGLSGGVCEKDVNLALTLSAAERLAQLGASVSLTRTDDSFPTLTDRWSKANSELPDFFIALHHNSIEYVKDTAAVAGVEAYYHKGENEAFAEALLNAVALTSGRPKNFTEDSYFYVCRQTAFRSALFEFGYLVNPAEMESCFSAAGLRAGAFGLARGLTSYLAAYSQ